MGFCGTIFIASMGIYCLKKAWCRPTSPKCWPYTPTSLWHAIVDDDVEAAPIYKSGGKMENPVRPCENHDLCMEWEALRLESHCKQSFVSKSFLSWIIGHQDQNLGNTNRMHGLLCDGIWPHVWCQIDSRTYYSPFDPWRPWMTS